MDIENTPMTDDELQHWGIKGMKWGIRRFQKKDGSLTPAGRKRYDDDGDGGSDGNSGSRGSRQSGGDSGKKKLSEMTDEELQKAINRARMEDTYRQLRPEKESTGKRLMRSMINDAAIPAATAAGKKLMQQALEKYGGNLLKDAVDPNSLEAKKKVLELLKVDRELEIFRNGLTSDSKATTFDEVVKKAQAKETEAKNRKAADEEDAKRAALADPNSTESIQKQVENAKARNNLDKEYDIKRNRDEDLVTNRIKKQAEKTRAQNEKRAAELITAKLEEDARAKTVEAEAKVAEANAKKAEAKARETLANEKISASKENAEAGKAFVDAYGDVLFRYGDDD